MWFPVPSPPPGTHRYPTVAQLQLGVHPGNELTDRPAGREGVFPRRVLEGTRRGGSGGGYPPGTNTNSTLVDALYTPGDNNSRVRYYILLSGHLVTRTRGGGSPGRGRGCVGGYGLYGGTEGIAVLLSFPSRTPYIFPYPLYPIPYRGIHP